MHKMRESFPRPETEFYTGENYHPKLRNEKIAAMYRYFIVWIKMRRRVFHRVWRPYYLLLNIYRFVWTTCFW